TAVVIARPTSQANEVTTSNARKRFRFSHMGAPATNDIDVSGPRVNGQNDRFINRPKAKDATAPYTANIASSNRPFACSSRPAPRPTRAAASIRYGSHGPTPPVIRAETARVVDPTTKPSPGPNTRPPSTFRKKTGSIPPAPAPSGR